LNAHAHRLWAEMDNLNSGKVSQSVMLVIFTNKCNHTNTSYVHQRW